MRENQTKLKKLIVFDLFKRSHTSFTLITLIHLLASFLSIVYSSGPLLARILTKEEMYVDLKGE
jgi:cell division protein FtsL